MISQDSQFRYESTRAGLWSEYAHQLISIHASCSLAWWSLTLTHQPSHFGSALLCWLTSGWILVRQCSPLTQRNAWFSSISVILVCVLAWFATWQQLGLAISKEEAIFGWWTLSAILIASELISRREYKCVHRSGNSTDCEQSISMNSNSPTANDAPHRVLSTEGDTDDSQSVQHANAVPSGDMRPNATRGLKWAALLVLALLLVYMVVVPSIEYAVERMTPPKSGRVLEDMTFAEKMRLHSVTGVVMLTFLALGGTIGSFLNVVIYRVPRGKRLLWPPSSCASCRTRIHGRDNIPILGWILLSGRCRTCNAPISARYPIIEAIVATLFISLYYVELLSGGENIPVRMPNSYRGVVWILLYTKWDLLGLYFYHCAMLSVLLAVAMMNFDGFRLPIRAAVFLLVAFALLSIASPALHPVPVPRIPAFATCLVGLVVGGGIGCVVQLLFPVKRNLSSDVPATPNSGEAASTTSAVPATEDPEQTEVTAVGGGATSLTTIDICVASDQTSKYGDPAMVPTAASDATFAMALLGVALGPHAVLSVTLLMVPFLAAYQLPAFGWLRSRPTTLFIFAVAFGHQIFWDQFHRLLGFAG